jgi:hypothetical protein
MLDACHAWHAARRIHWPKNAIALFAIDTPCRALRASLPPRQVRMSHARVLALWLFALLLAVSASTGPPKGFHLVGKKDSLGADLSPHYCRVSQYKCANKYRDDTVSAASRLGTPRGPLALDPKSRCHRAATLLPPQNMSLPA